MPENVSASSFPAASQVVGPKPKKPFFKSVIPVTIFLLLAGCLVWNYFQYQQINTFSNQNKTLIQQNQTLSTKFGNLEKQTQKYLELQGEKCSGDVEQCLTATITRIQTKPILTKASGGLCLIRG